MQTDLFWEERARRFAAEGQGLAAVCSFAMPAFYNRSIDVTQRAALRHVLKAIRPGDQVLDYGCGVGRWTLEMARRGAQVTAVDFSASMLAQARTRVEAAGLSQRCRFVHCDVTDFQTHDKFDLALGVTVLQHVLDDGRLNQTVRQLSAMIKPGGRLVIVEAAPTKPRPNCDTGTFHSRTSSCYLTKLEDAGLKIISIRGVDPMPFKLWVVPRFRKWPKLFALGALAGAAALALPIDLLFARSLTSMSWHKIFIAIPRVSP